MTPTRSRTIGSAFATLTLWTLMASQALGELTASPNHRATGRFTVSDASPPTLSQNVTTGAVRRFYSCNLVETQPSGTDISYNLGRGPVSRSFTGKSAGTYS